ncbi:hypothetical protein Krac_6885 [Ktedonobacter racemifer DSM 44963]|uniref:Uncharacterized protein n=1 Tax=Ktedonobacter racemifer DSM 44963 TaxID=485913 RepID=D6TPP3_KTERA|nr:hypothetical protein Krac_6885 [Ktedonobacter racemifer DSM 44963]
MAGEEMCLCEREMSFAAGVLLLFSRHDAVVLPFVLILMYCSFCSTTDTHNALCQF